MDREVVEQKFEMIFCRVRHTYHGAHGAPYNVETLCGLNKNQRNADD